MLHTMRLNWFGALFLLQLHETKRDTFRLNLWNFNNLIMAQFIGRSETFSSLHTFYGVKATIKTIITRNSDFTLASEQPEVS